MEANNVKKISLSTFFLVLAIIVLIAMAIFVLKLSKDKSAEIQKSDELQSKVTSLNETVSDLQGKLDSISNTINTPSTSSSTTNNTTSTSSNTTNNKNSNTTNEQNINIIGKWNTCKAGNVKTGEGTDNMTDIFGSSYIKYGSYLELKEDGTFLDAIQPITDGSQSTEGSYTVKQSYYKTGDCYIFLNYSDGTQKTLQVVYYDNTNTPYLVMNEFLGDYQLSFKK